MRGRAATALVALVGLLAAHTATAPLAGADNPIAIPVIDLGVTVELTPYVQIPNTNLGRARLNQFAVSGDRFFVVEDFDGLIYELKDAPNTQGGTAELFFDVKLAIRSATDRNLDNTSIFHGGLRAVAFHPEFAENGLLYTSVMESRPNNAAPSRYLSDVNNPIVADGVLIEWKVNPATGRPDPSSYREIFRVGMPVYDHPIKGIAFNPFARPGNEDYGLLYIAHGDGSVQSATAGGGLRNDALGKILRVDPTRQGNGAPYGVPATNPFVGDNSMLDEVYSLGHRNPHHLAFGIDAAGRSHLIAAEAGRDNVEEVNIIQSGANYGWSEREGTFVHLPGGDLIDGIAPLPANEAQNGYTYPAAQYGHEGVRGSGFSGQAIAGGYVVQNGSALDGQYFYSDFPLSGKLFNSSWAEMLNAVTLLDPNDPNRDSPSDLTQARTGLVSILFDHDSNPATPSLPRTSLTDVFNDAATYDGSGRADVRFGQGPDGALYISSKKNGLVYLVTNSLPSSETCEGRTATVSGLTGTPGNDVIIGTSGPDVINGGGGNDIICARGGADVINGGSGADRINAGWGSDVVRGGDGNDVIWGGPGLDNLEGGSGDDLIRGGKGGDRIVGNAGNDELYGGDRKDRVFGYGGDDRLFGGAGEDNLRGGAGTNAATGGIGVDICVDVSTRQGCERTS